MRTVLATLLLVAGAVRAADDADPLATADRDEMEALCRSIESVGDPRWTRDATALRRAFEAGTFMEGVRASLEVHGVALQRGHTDGADRTKGAPTQATVRVTRTGCGVILVLCGQEAIDWRIELDEGVDLRMVLLYGKGAQRVRGLPASKIDHRDRVFVPSHRDLEFPRFAELVSKRVPGRTLHTYNGRVDPGNRPLVVGEQGEVWRRQMLLQSMRELEFRALKERRDRELRAANGTVFPMIVWARGGSRWFCNATATGIVESSLVSSPATTMAVAIDPESGHRYYLDRIQIVECGAGGRTLRTLPLPEWIGRPGFAADFAFDGLRRRLVVISMLGQMGEYSIAEREWRPLGDATTAVGALPMGNFGVYGILSAMTWDARRDCFWALYSNGGAQRLRRFSAQGVAAQKPNVFNLPVKLQSGPGNGVRLRMLGDHVVIFTVDWSGRRTRETSNSFVVDPLTGKVLGSNELRMCATLPGPARSELPLLWAELNGPDCYSAIQRLGRSGDAGVEFLRAEWTKLPSVDPIVFRRALEELASPDAGLRSHAAARLAGVGTSMRDAIREAIENADSAEVRMTLTWMLEEIDRGPDLVARLECVLAAVATPQAAAFRRELRGERSR